MAATVERMTNGDVYDMMTAAIIAKLKAGVVPWRRPWASDFPHRFPTNLKSMKAYRGLNVFQLMAHGYDSPYWLSFKQAKELGGSVKKGERSTLVTFWKTGTTIRDTETGEDRKILLLRYYRVFNVEQCEGLMPKRSVGPTDEKLGKVSETDSIKAADAIKNGYIGFAGPTLLHTGDRACYSPDLDKIRMPAKKKFASLAAYYNVLFHEMIHSTGHTSRLKRDMTGHMGSDLYSKEELVAEMGAHFLMMEAGVQCEEQTDLSASYISHWIQKLGDDPKFVVNAASLAQRGVDHILGRTWDDAKPETSDEE